MSEHSSQQDFCCMENFFFGSPVVVCRFCNPTSVKATTLAYFRHWIVSPESLTQFEIQRSISQSKFLSWLLFVCLLCRYELQAIVCYCVVQNLEEFLVKWHWNLSQNFTRCSLTLPASVFSLETLDHYELQLSRRILNICRLKMNLGMV